MRALITFGPTFEPLDQVRQLTNFSTGTLGTRLANFLADRGWEVTALRGHYSTCRTECRASAIHEFTTTQTLLDLLRESSQHPFNAVFHAAAVSDFSFGKVFSRDISGALHEVAAGKFSTRQGTLLAELLPAPKLIARLREFFPSATLFGWKYEVDGNRESAVAAGLAQMRASATDFCVLNGPAFGPGYGVLAPAGSLEDCPEAGALFEALTRRVRHSG